MRKLLALVVLLSALEALADPYDFRIFQLGNPVEGGTSYSPEANGNFRVFARQFAAAMSSTNLMPPETLGHSGFAVSADLSVIDFGSAAKLPTEKTFTGPMLMPGLHVRKGLPWSFEVGARASWIEKSRMAVVTVELKWALNEGFTYLPDIGIKIGVTRLVNSRDLNLTVGGTDLGIGKQFAIGGMVTLTPYVGWNLGFVGASTDKVDFRPSRTLAEADKSTEQFKDVFIYNELSAFSNTHNRFYGGLRFIGGVLMIGAEFSYTVIGKFKDDTTKTDRDVPSVMAFNATLGLDF